MDMVFWIREKVVRLLIFIYVQIILKKHKFCHIKQAYNWKFMPTMEAGIIDREQGFSCWVLFQNDNRYRQVVNAKYYRYINKCYCLWAYIHGLQTVFLRSAIISKRWSAGENTLLNNRGYPNYIVIELLKPNIIRFPLKFPTRSIYIYYVLNALNPLNVSPILCLQQHKKCMQWCQFVRCWCLM